MTLAVDGKGGISKSAINCNISTAVDKGSKKVLPIGCDLKHDSTFTLTWFLNPHHHNHTLQEKNFHYENICPKDVICKSYVVVSRESVG